MSSDINLSAAIRTSLITLQGTQTLIDRTQNDLSTGLKVNNAIDNPVAFFQAAALTDRASDFSNKKDGIDQGISSLSTALEGVTGVENIVGQLQGLILSAESASSTQISGIVTQFNTLRTQVNSLAKDTSYQGLNLVDGTGQLLQVSFSTLTASNLTVKSVDVTSGPRGLSIVQVTTQTTLAASTITTAKAFELSWLSSTGYSLTAGKFSQQTFYFTGTGQKFSSGNVVFKYGSVTLTITIGSKGTTTANTVWTTTHTFTNTQTFHFAIGSASGAKVFQTSKALSSIGVLKTVTGQWVINQAVNHTNNVLTQFLQTNLLTLRAQAQTIGSNVALLNTRLDFTNNYVNLLTAGSGKLTLADLNEEGANLLSLQTRQQLGIQALSFAGQNERAVLSLFR